MATVALPSEGNPLWGEQFSSKLFLDDLRRIAVPLMQQLDFLNFEVKMVRNGVNEKSRSVSSQTALDYLALPRHAIAGTIVLISDNKFDSYITALNTCRLTEDVEALI